VYTENVSEKAFLYLLDEIIRLLREAGKCPPLAERIINLTAAIVGILGAIELGNLLRSWIGGWHGHGLQSNPHRCFIYLQRRFILRRETA